MFLELPWSSYRCYLLDWLYTLKRKKGKFVCLALALSSFPRQNFRINYYSLSAVDSCRSIVVWPNQNFAKVLLPVGFLHCAALLLPLKRTRIQRSSLKSVTITCFDKVLRLHIMCKRSTLSKQVIEKIFLLGWKIRCEPVKLLLFLR